jgi:hypothetical protein
MAVAARPGPSDARVPCPQCGGLVHPIAGRCKHCKADLSSYRSARPAASTPLPALHQAAASGHAHPHAPSPHAIAHAVTLPGPAPESRAVLPPRPTGSFPTAAPGRGTWRSWPVMVIALAAAAIVAAVVLMVWPEATRREGKRALPAPPAPERMVPQSPPPEPSPAPPARAGQGQADPWSQNDRAAPARPSAPAAPSQVPDDDTDPDDDAQAAPRAPAQGRWQDPSAVGNTMVVFAMANHLCRKAASCGVDDPMLRNMCDTIARNPDPPLTCAAAERCLRQIDAMSCATSQSDDFSQLPTLIAQFRDCADAVRC